MIRFALRATSVAAKVSAVSPDWLTISKIDFTGPPTKKRADPKARPIL